MERKRNGRVFLDMRDTPYWIRNWEGGLWLFRWQPGGQWVSLREVSFMEAGFYPDNLTEAQQDLYHEKAGSDPFMPVEK